MAEHKRNLSPAPEAAGVTTIPLGLKIFLYITAGINGAAVMIVEILGAKMLSPYVGTSHFVWTAQIAVTLIALACGYYAGGRLVDRSTRLNRLYWAVIISAAWLACTVAIRRWVIFGLLSLPLAASSLLASLILYFVPLSLLAMTGPFLVRVVTQAVHNVGGNVGRLNAISTFGSFLGTVVISYVLIPLLPNSITMFAVSALLLVISLLYFLIWGRKGAAAARAGIAAAAVLAAGLFSLRTDNPVIPGAEEIYRGNSNFGMLQVFQLNGHYRYYLNDYLIQNTYDTDQGESTSLFTYMLEGLARDYTAKLDRVLCVGMGVGIVPRDIARGGSKVDVVEINPAVVPVAEKYFDLDPKAFNLTIGDGRCFLNESPAGVYDAVILDAFLGDSVPSHLMTREAFQEMRRVLSPGGVLVINTFADTGTTTDFLGSSLYKTLSAVFSSVLVHGTPGSNTLFVASAKPALAMLHTPSYAGVHPDALAEVHAAYARLWKPDVRAGIVLTDDYNPSDYYDAANREKLRRDLAMSMKG